MNSGVDGFTGEPMPSAVAVKSPLVNHIVREAAIRVARVAFGEEFAGAVRKLQEEN